MSVWKSLVLDHVSSEIKGQLLVLPLYTRDNPLLALVGWNYSAVSFSMATMGLWGQPIVLVITYPSDQSSGSYGKCLFAIEHRRLTKSTQ